MKYLICKMQYRICNKERKDNRSEQNNSEVPEWDF